GRAARVAGDCSRVPDVLQAINRTHIAEVLPGSAVIVRRKHSRGRIIISNDVINATVGIDCDRWILEAGRRSSLDAIALDRANRPGCAIVERDNHAALTTALIEGHIYSSVFRRDFYVTV